MKRFYEKRLPWYTRYHRTIFFFTLLGSIGSSFFAYVEFNSWVVVASAICTAASSWEEFSNVVQNIQRYNDTLQELKKLSSWWKGLPPLEKASPQKLAALVGTSEDIICSECRSWAQSMQSAQELVNQKMGTANQDPRKSSA